MDNDKELINFHSRLDRPIPGEGLTSDPKSPWPWEKPPAYVSVMRASEHIFEKLTDEELHSVILDAMEDDIPVMDITRFILFQGFTEGLWNADLLLLLIEPTAYMLLAIAEKAGINPVLTRDENLEPDEVDEDEQEEVLREAQNVNNNSIGTRGRFQDAKLAKISPTSVGPDIQKQIETLDTSKLKASLLQKQEDNKSLLAKKEV